MDPRKSLDVEAWVAAARLNVVTLRESREIDRILPAKSAPRRHLKTGYWTGVAATIAVLGFAVYRILGLFVVPSFTTLVGEQRTIKLADGSLVVLNARSHIEVKFQKKSREVRSIHNRDLGS